MAQLMEFTTAPESFRPLYENLVRSGHNLAPRGEMTCEIEDMTIVIHDPTKAWCNPPGRNGKFAIAAAEALQLIGGFSDPQRMTEIAPNFHNFLNGGILLGAYGVRLQPIIPQVVAKLTDDPLSRQGVAIIWEPMRDLMTRGNKDTPCTIGATFRLRRGRLNMTTHMRSNDLFWGWTYDVFQFTQLQCSIANVLGAEVGTYTHHADSFHFYTRDHLKLDRVEDVTFDYHDMSFTGVQGKTVREMQERAHGLFYGQIPSDATETEKEMSNACRLM